MKPESAEMIKHSINSFLANSICYINEITRISNSVGADPKEVSFGLKSDERIGYKSYLSPGGPFGGGTLGRDLTFLKKISKKSPAPQSPKQKLPTSLPISEKGEFEKRLQFLKSLRDKKLIDDDEYKNKKIELLSQFP